MTQLSRRHVLTAATGGLFASASQQVMAEDKKSGTPDFWRAWATTVGEDTELTVEGIYQEGGYGLVAVLKPAKTKADDSKTLILELSLVKLPGVWPLVLIPIPVHFAAETYKKGRYDSVEIRYPTGKKQTIKEISDAGDGPRAPVRKPRKP